MSRPENTRTLILGFPQIDFIFKVKPDLFCWVGSGHYHWVICLQNAIYKILIAFLDLIRDGDLGRVKNYRVIYEENSNIGWFSQDVNSTDGNK